MEARPWAALGSWAGFRNSSLQGHLAGAVHPDLAPGARDPAKSELLAGDLLSQLTHN